MDPSTPNTTIYSPYKLVIVILDGTNLPIADTLSSDPYVVLFLDNKKIGKTRTIRKTLNPVWEQLFRTDLLHIKSKLKLRVYDEDFGKDDDLMGIVTIDLSEIPLNCELQKRYDLEQASGAIKARGSINVSISLGKNENIVQIVPEISISSDVGTLQHSSHSLISLGFIDGELESTDASEAIKTTLKRFVLEGKAFAFYPALIRDLLLDVNSLLKNKYVKSDIMSAASDYLHFSNLTAENTFYKRRELRLVNSTKMNMTTKHCSRHPPTEQNTIQFIVSGGIHGNGVVLKFVNRYMMWHMIKWFRVLFEIWTDPTSNNNNSPSWLGNGSYLTTSNVTVICGKEVFTGKLLISTKNPFQIIYNQSIISLQGWSDLLISSDSLAPQSYVLNIEICSCSLNGSFSDLSFDGSITNEERESINENIKSDSNSKSGFKNFLRGSITGAVRGVGTIVTGATNVVTTVGGNVVNVTSGAALGVASTTVGAARTIATGDHNIMMSAVQDTVIGVMDGATDLANLVTNARGIVFRSDNYFIIAKCKDVTFKSGRKLREGMIFNEQFHIDAVADNFHSSKITNALGVFKKDGSLQPFTEDFDENILAMDNSNVGIDFYLIHCTTLGVESVIGHSYIPISKLLYSDNKFSTVTLNDRDSKESIVTLNSSSGVSIQVMHGKGIALPHKKYAGLFVKCKLVDQNGHSANKVSSDFKSNSVPMSPNPVWNQTFLFTSDYNLSHSHYIRIELCANDNVLQDASFGAIFIPLEYFKTKQAQYTFNLFDFRNSWHMYCNPHDKASHNAVSLGEITVIVQKIIEETDVKSALKIQSTLYDSNVLNSLFFGECLLVGNIDSSGLSNNATGETMEDNIEEFLMYPSFDCLILHSHHKNYDLELLSFDEFDVEQNDTKKNDSSQQSIQIEIFENQRRQIYPPFDWSSNSAITRRPLFSDLTYDIPYKLDVLSNAIPPNGYEWTSTWEIDKSTVKTDPEGWIYGFTFGRLLTQYAKKKTEINPLNTHARRRRYIRYARAISNINQSDVLSSKSNIINAFSAKNRISASTIVAFKSAVTTTLSSISTANNNTRSSIATADGRQSTTFSNSEYYPSDDSNMWRAALYESNPDLVVALCQERANENSSVIISWSNVTNVTIITSSILSIRFTVNRYFGEDNTNNLVFRPAEIELFVSNCPSYELHSLISERILFFEVRPKMKILIESGSLYGDRTNQQFDVGRIETSQLPNYVPETEELSLGSKLAADLDNEGMKLERKIYLLNILLSKSDKKDIRDEKNVLIRRVCRIRLYLAALLSVELIDGPDISEEAVRKHMDRDFKSYLGINLSNEVSTANSRIEFLLDSVETRIRDSALCSWSQRSELQRSLEILVNGYYIEIAGLMAKFFDDEGFTAMKGLGSKIQLISNYMENNDRLDAMLRSALRPYELKAVPAPYLSLYLDFNTLLSWYASVLQSEMRGNIDQVINLWKDPTKDASGFSSKYSFKLPWIPQRFEQGGGFKTAIPEDALDYLTNYLSIARLDKDKVAPSFRSSVKKLDMKVNINFVSAFRYLSEHYQNSLLEKDWTNCEDDEIMEYSEWLCATANDCYRIINNNILSIASNKSSLASSTNQNNINKNDQIIIKKSVSNDEIDSEAQKLIDLTNRTYSSFSSIMKIALDHFSGIIFTFLFHGKDKLLLEKEFCKEWIIIINNSCQLLTSTPAPGATDPFPVSPSTQYNTNEHDLFTGNSYFSDIINDLKDQITSAKDYLSSYCYNQLVLLCIEKIITFYLLFLKDLKLLNYIILQNGPESTQIIRDIESIKSQLFSIIDHTSLDEWMNEEIINKMDILNNTQALIFSDFTSKSFVDSLNTLHDGSKKYPQYAIAYGRWVEFCLGLRGMKEFLNSKKPNLIINNNSIKNKSVLSSINLNISSNILSTSSPNLTSKIIIEESPQASKSNDHQQPSLVETNQNPIQNESKNNKKNTRMSIFSGLFGHHKDEKQASVAEEDDDIPIIDILHDFDQSLMSSSESQPYNNNNNNNNELDDLNGEEDDVLANQSENIRKSQIFKDWIVDSVNDMKNNHNNAESLIPPGKGHTVHDVRLIDIPVIARVFHPELEVISLQSQLLYSSFNPIKHNKTKNDQNNNSNNNSNVGSNSNIKIVTGISNMFHHLKSPKNPSIHHGHSARRNSLTTSNVSKVHTYRIIITHLQIENLFFVDRLRSPYLTIHLLDFNYKTTVRKDNASPDWTVELCPIEIIVSNSDVSMLLIEFCLHYRGLLADKHIGSFLMEVNPLELDTLSVSHKKLSLDVTHSAQKIQQIIPTIESEGRLPPVMILSLEGKKDTTLHTVT
eukprot:gene6726-9219_t